MDKGIILRPDKSKSLTVHVDADFVVCLSTTEDECVALSQSLREVIPMMNLVKEFKSKNVNIYSSTPINSCTAFQDKNGALELGKVPKMRSRTKHINIVYHHFREHVRRREVSIHPITTELQIADIFTKPLDPKSFIRHRRQIMKL
jgi:hypothetical protein